MEADCKAYIGLVKLLGNPNCEGKDFSAAVQECVALGTFKLTEHSARRLVKVLAYDDLRWCRWSDFVDNTVPAVFKHFPGEPGVKECVSLISNMIQKMMRTVQNNGLSKARCDRDREISVTAKFK